MALLSFRKVRPNARVRLLLFSYAGSGAAVYRTWPELFPEAIEVCPVELPGHGARLGEPLVEDLTVLRDRLVDELAPLLDRPIALFGHSLGAKLAFEMSKKLGQRTAHLFISASIAPDVPAVDPIAHLPRDKFILRLREWGAAPKQVLDDADLMDLLLPIVRADLRLADRYRVFDRVRAPCGVTVFAGTGDAQAPLAKVHGWEAYSGGPFRFVPVAAGHFYIAEVAPMLAAEIARDLAAAGLLDELARSG
jgi:surfactin synthase thioesterase subunit